MRSTQLAKLGLMKTLLPVLLLPAIMLSACTVLGKSDVPDMERRAQDLNETIMCPVCPGESIDQSANPLAGQMRDIVYEKLNEGWTDRQIEDFFVERYGAERPASASGAGVQPRGVAGASRRVRSGDSLTASDAPLDADERRRPSRY